MAKEKGFGKKRIFKIARELNVSKDRLIQFLEENGYHNALSGKGLNTSIVQEAAYRKLLEEYGDNEASRQQIQDRGVHRVSGGQTGGLKKRALNYLRQALDEPDASFRNGQWEAIRDLVVENKTLLLVRRTGWGKSMVYFLATRLLRDKGAGPTILVSPLLSLMRDQIKAAERIGVRAVKIDGNTSKDEKDQIAIGISSRDIDVILTTPEQLRDTESRGIVLDPAANQAGLFVVDEAHCISDWGHDFRPDYQRIVRILQAGPDNSRVLATTATANDRVVNDVIHQLGSQVEVSRGPLARSSLLLQNISMPSPTRRLAWLAERVPNLPGSGIIYTLTTRDADRVADWLQSQGIEALAYHSKLCREDRAESDRIREERERLLQENSVKALVATLGLGMGFDKPDLAFVIHYQRPGSVVDYYQQVGRAGRDGNDAYGILLHGAEDDDIIDFFIRKAFPLEGHVKAVLDALDAVDGGLKRYEIAKQGNLRIKQVQEVLDYLSVRSPAPVTKEGTFWHRTPVQYTPDREKVERITAIRREEQREMQRYMEHRDCLMMFLQAALDDPNSEPCGRCAQCVGDPLVAESVTDAKAREAAAFLRRSEVPIKPRKQWPYTDALSSYGWENTGPYGTMELNLRAEEGRALSIWGDAGWGQLVKHDKQVTGVFDDRLVEAARAMIEDRWQPDPAPQWVTCVPSNNHPHLVPSYARRLAEALNLPFVACVQKVRDNEPQKNMENKYRQTSNLDGVFKVDTTQVANSPLLLIDDTVDSRWTLTVITALLREAGSGPVLPLALAKTTPTST